MQTRTFSPCPLGPLPAWVQPLAAAAGALPSVCQTLDQLTINEYEPGVGLSPHVDTHSAFTGAIVSLSLGSTTVMEFRRQINTTNNDQHQEEGSEQAGSKGARDCASVNGTTSSVTDGSGGGCVVDDDGHVYECRQLLLPPRSLLVMSGEARYAW